MIAPPMLELSSTDAVLAGLAHADRIAAQAYTIGGPILHALEAAARRGARVVVRLEGHPFNDRDGHLAEANAHLAHELREAGADAGLGHPLHAKAISVDGTLYLDEKNWRPGDLVLREDDAAAAESIPMIKHAALAQEAQLLTQARANDGAIIESESFGCCNAVYSELRKLARADAAPRLLVSERELRGNDRERHLLRDLMRAGVRVRVCKDSEKLAVAGEKAWLGSANATIAYGDSDMTDWGLCTENAEIVGAVRTRLEAQWDAAAKFKF